MKASENEELLFVPLGGAGEIGMNLSLYGYGPPGAHRWLMVDCGVTFGGDGIPGTDVMMPNASFIAEQRENLAGLVLTHAHEDHLGAVPYLWPQLQCPVYATAFTLAILRRKLEERGLLERVQPTLIPPDGKFTVGPFNLEMIGVTHSIPEAHSVAIRTRAGTVVHSGDWKLDPEPVVGPASDEAALSALGDAGVLAFVCDSTNVFNAGKTGSEGAILSELTRLVAACSQRVVVTCFATNIARLHTIGQVAQATGRDVVMAGASLKRNYVAARECGYLGNLPRFQDEAVCRKLARKRTLLVCTGGQGERRAALSRIAQGAHPYLALERGDAVLFSSRVIPGNEPSVGRLHNALLRLGVELITHRDGMIHVSGHPAREDLTQMYRLIRPQVALPVHGELRHMLEHAKLARTLNVKEAIVAENGTIVRLAPGSACVVDHVPVGRMSLEGNRPVAADSEIVRGRLKALDNGTVFTTVVLDRAARIVQDVHLSSIGLLEQTETQIVEAIRLSVREAVADLPSARYADDDAVRGAVRIAVRRVTRRFIEKRPVVHVHIVRT
ncbi:MAG: ribonuclease J [Rhodospirillales bacterium]|nr:ribonuclease J [Rhodospirillales bacterium]